MESLAKKLIANRIVEAENLRQMKSISDLDLNDENIFIDTRQVHLG